MTTRSLSYTSNGEGRPAGLPDTADVLRRAAGENFAVASRVLPASARRHLIAFYGYARLTDEIGDSYAGDRLAALDWLEGDVRAALDGRTGAHPLVAAATRSASELDMDPQPLLDLVEANRLDQAVHDYATFDQLQGCCTLSANPVGRMVLASFGVTDPARIELSDCICTGLQLVEHWQDVREDALAGRIYVPAVDRDRFGVEPADLRRPAPAGPNLRALMAFEVARARAWLDRGTPLLDGLPGRARLAVAGFVAGGHAALDDIARRDFDVLRAPRRPRARHVARRLLMTTSARRKPRP
ncbi:MAG TPA: squalene synthase HpnC [Acidimicrobiales bacterium]|nr:squalene synthase HpnC [Acidimicrobiales bacterium]